MAMFVLAMTGCVGAAVSKTSSVSVDEITIKGGDNDNKKLFEDDRFRVEVAFGLDGVIKANTYMPVTLNIENKGGDFSGTARVIMPNMSEIQDGIAYEKSVALAENANKNIMIPIPSVSSLTYFYVEIEDDNGKLLMSKKVRTGAEQTNNRCLVGILSEDTNSLGYFGSITLTGTNDSIDTRILELTEKNFPEESNSLSSLSYIIVNNYSTEKLSEEQRKAITDWTEKGGTLIVGTGSHYEKVLAKLFDQTITGTIGDLKSQSIRLDDSKNKVVQTNVNAIDLKVKDALVLRGIADGLNVYQIKKGSGSINILPVDLGEKGLSEWSERGDFAVELLQGVSTEEASALLDSSDLQYDYYWNLQNVLDFYRDVKMPNAVIYLLIFLAYVLIIGPIGYFILKKKDRREVIWIMIPAAALIFYGGLYVISSGSRMSTPVATSFTMVNLENGSKNEEVYVSLLNPDGKNYSAQFKPECVNFKPIIQDNGYYYNSGSTKENYKYKYAVNTSNKGTMLQIQDGKSFSKQIVSFEKLSQTTTDQFEVKLNASTKEISGTITNHSGYDLQNVYFYYNNIYVNIGELKKGAVYKITADNCQNLSANYYQEMIEQMVTYPPNPTNEERIERTQLINMYRFFAVRYLQNLSDYQNGYIFGIADDEEHDYISTQKIKEAGKTLVVGNFVQNLSDVGEVYVSNLNQGSVYDVSGDIDLSSGYLYGDSAQVVYSLDKNWRIDALMKDKGLFAGKIYAENHINGKFEEIFANSNELSGKDLKKYINAVNEITIRYEAASTGNNTNGSSRSNTTLPKISVTGGYQ